MILAGVGEPDQCREDCPSGNREIEAHGAQHLSCQTLRLTDEPKEQMLTAEVVMVQLERFLRHQVESVPSSGGGMGLAGWRSDKSLVHGAFQFNSQVAREDVHRHHDSQAQIPAFAEHPEEQVLGSDEAVVMAPRLVESELDGLDETGRRPDRQTNATWQACALRARPFAEGGRLPECAVKRPLAHRGNWDACISNGGGKVVGKVDVHFRHGDSRSLLGL